MKASDTVCTFQDGSYPCGNKDNPDCVLCHKIFKAGIKEVVDTVNLILKLPYITTDNIKLLWQSKLKKWGIDEDVDNG